MIKKGASQEQNLCLVSSSYRLRTRMRDQDKSLKTTNGALWEVVKTYSEEQVLHLKFLMSSLTALDLFSISQFCATD